MICHENPDIVIGTESWLNDSILSSEVFPANFNVFRRDRKTSKGGGVFIAVKNIFVASNEPTLVSDCESVWISLQVKGLAPVYIGAFYRPQSTDRDYLLELDASLSKIPNNAAVWLMGDFNLPSVDWESMSFTPGGNYPAISKTMIDITNDHNLYQVVKEPTRESNILDLCFTNTPALVDSVQVVNGISDHDMVTVEALLKPKVVRPPKRKVFLYHKANFPNVDIDMEEFNNSLTEERLSSLSMDSLYDAFKTALFESIDRNIPTKLSSSRFSYPWVNSSIKRDIRRKQRLYNKSKKYGNPRHRLEFKQLRRTIDKKIKKSYNTYIRDVIGGSLKSDNTKSFWNFIKSKRTDSSGVSPLQVDGNLLTCAKDKAEALNRQYCSVFTNENTADIPNLPTSSVPDIDNITITTNGVLKLLNELNIHKATGPDGITARVLRTCSSSIAPILQKLFEKSLSTGCLPSDWLDANITPIFKKGDKSAPSNYRPVSLTSTISKLLEHIIHGHIMNNLKYVHNTAFAKGGHVKPSYLPLLMS